MSAASPQAIASNPRQSAWVAANAGSGKTHVLVQRILRLLLDGADPQRILCLTFTKAAAAEMSARLYKQLAGWIALDDEALRAQAARLGETGIDQAALSRARRLFARALETPGGLKIQTIHAFCERLLQLFPLEAGVTPGFQVIEEGDAIALREDCRRDVLAASDPELAGAKALLAARTDAQGFAKLLHQLSRQRQDFDASPASVLRLRAALGLDASDTPETLAQEMTRLGPGDFARTAAILESGPTKTEVKTGAGLRQVVAAAGTPLARDLIASLLFTRELKPRSLKMLMPESSQKRHPGLIDVLDQAQQRYQALFDKQTALEMCDATAALTLIARRIAALYDARKRTLGSYDFDDLIARARALITQEAAGIWVLYKLDGGIDHVLVDEAQDTSAAQWEIVRALTGEFFAGEGSRPGVIRTVFAVGDRKQSIFSFQGADPEAFDQAESYFRKAARGAGQEMPKPALTVSFRSVETVLNAVDQTFARATAAEGVTADGKPPDDHVPSRAGETGLVEIWPPVVKQEIVESDPWSAPVDRQSRDHPRQILARDIAQTISRWLAEGRSLIATGRPVEPGDILILVRRRNSFSDALIRELRQRGVAVAGADRMKLGEHAAVADLMTLARAVLLPEDDLSLAELLKSPLCRKSGGAAFDDEDLYSLAHGRGQASLWSRLCARPEYADMVAEIERWRVWALEFSPFEFFARVLNLGQPSGRERLMARLGPEVNDPLDAFLDQALGHEQTSAPSLLRFLDWFEEGGAEIKRDMEQGQNEVRIMTVHGAKGLEAGIVFLADTADVPRPDHRAALKFIDPADGLAPLVLWDLPGRRDPPALTAFLAQTRAREMAEYRRLLYVAMTRARDELYVCCACTGAAPHEESWYSLIAAALAPGASLPGEIVRRTGMQTAAIKAPLAANTAASVTPPPPWRTWSALPATEIAPPLRASAPVRSGDDQALRRGRLIHRLLHMLSNEPADLRAALARRTAAREGYGPEAADEALAVLAEPAFAHWFGPDSFPEVEIAGQGGTPVCIDRLLVLPGEIRVLDFKTARHPPRDASGIAADDLNQLRTYATLLAKAFPGRRIRAALLFTADLRLIEVI